MWTLYHDSFGNIALKRGETHFVRRLIVKLLPMCTQEASLNLNELKNSAFEGFFKVKKLTNYIVCVGRKYSIFR